MINQFQKIVLIDSCRFNSQRIKSGINEYNKLAFDTEKIELVIKSNEEEAFNYLLLNSEAIGMVVIHQQALKNKNLSQQIKNTTFLSELPVLILLKNSKQGIFCNAKHCIKLLDDQKSPAQTIDTIVKMRRIATAERLTQKHSIAEECTQSFLSALLVNLEESITRTFNPNL